MMYVQSTDTGNIGNKTQNKDKTKHTTQKNMSNTDPTKKEGSGRIQVFEKSKFHAEQLFI